MVPNKARILVVDDNVDVRRLVADILTRAGHEVVQAGDGSEAGRVWRDMKLDLVILDLYMPEKDGIEALRELTASLPGIPTIVMSGGGAGSGAHTRKSAVLLGAFLCIEKPFTPAVILEAVRRAVAGDGRNTG